jgi:hypothetical protein
VRELIMMGSVNPNRQTNYLLAFLGTAVALVAFLLIATSPPLNPSVRLILIWVLIIPLAYVALSERGRLAAGSEELPGVPIGSRWEPRPPRPKASDRGPEGNTDARNLRRALRKLGFSPEPVKDPDIDMVARSPEGKEFVVKVCEGQAGLLACQDAMRAMLDKGANDAIVLAPQGSTSTARRFVRRIRSRKGLHIRIWNSPPHPQGQSAT